MDTADFRALLPWMKTLAIISLAFAALFMVCLTWHLLAPEALGWMTGEQKAFSLLALLGLLTASWVLSAYWLSHD